MTAMERVETVQITGNVVQIDTTAGRTLTITRRAWRAMRDMNATETRLTVIALLDERNEEHDFIDFDHCAECCQSAIDRQGQWDSTANYYYGRG